MTIAFRFSAPIQRVVSVGFLTASLAACGIAFGQPQASRDWRMDDAERRVWALVDPAIDRAAPDRLAGLDALVADGDRPSTQQLVALFHACRLEARQAPGVRPGVADRLDRLTEALGTDRAGAARTKCAQWVAQAAGRGEEMMALGYQAHQLVTSATPPSIAGWIAYDHARYAHDAGLLDVAAEAIRDSMAFAQANGLTEWEAESLSELALIQTSVGQFEAAIASSDAAIALASGMPVEDDFRLHRCYIQRRAGRFGEAEATCKALIAAFPPGSRHALDAATNLAGILVEQGRSADALALIARTRPHVDPGADPSTPLYLDVAEAFALVQQGRVAEAVRLHSAAVPWFEENQRLNELAEHTEKWAELLLSKGEPRLAAEALAKVLELRKRTRELERRNNAALVSAMLTAESSVRENLRLEQENLAKARELDAQRARARLWSVVALAVVAAALLLWIGNLRLRRARLILAKANERLDYESTHDPLTRIFNRRYFSRFLEEAASKGAIGPALVVLLDIDHFKRINDTWGHKAGDEVLKVVSQRLAARLRAADRIVRWGGEEFLVYVDAPASPEQGEMVVRRLLGGVAGAPIDFDGESLHVTISAGFAPVSVGTVAEFEQAIAGIDAHLYEAKREGRNRAIGHWSEHERRRLHPEGANQVATP